MRTPILLINMKKIALLCLAAIALASCGNSEEQKSSKEPVKPDIKEIDSLASSAAKRIASIEITDTFALQGAIMEARAERSAYAIKGDRESALAYDSILHVELSKLNKELCNTIFVTPEPQPAK